VVVLWCVDVRPMRHIETMRDCEPPLLVLSAWQTAQISLRSDITSIECVAITVGENVVHLASVLGVSIGADHICTVASDLILQPTVTIHVYYVVLGIVVSEPGWVGLVIHRFWLRIPMLNRSQGIEFKLADFFIVVWVACKWVLDFLSLESDPGRSDTGSLIFLGLECEASLAVAAIESVVLKIGLGVGAMHCLPTKLCAVITLVHLHASFLTPLSICLAVVPAVVVVWALEIFLAHLTILTIS